MATEKPTGVKVFGILQIIFSAFTIFAKGFAMSISFALIAFLSAGLPEGSIPLFLQQANIPQSMFYFFAVYTILFNVVYLILGWLGLIASIGVLMTKSWARKMLVGVAISILSLNILAIIIGFALGQYKSALAIISTLVWFAFKVIYYGWLITYFNKIEIKKIFTPTR
jgi:hypothetical protein